MTKSKRLSPVWYFVIVNNAAVVLIILSMVLGVAGLVIAKVTYQEKYKNTALLFVCEKDDTSPDAYSQTRATTEQDIALAEVFVEALEGPQLDDLMADEMLVRTGYRYCDAKMNVEIVSDTSLVSIEIVGTDKYVVEDYMDSVLAAYPALCQDFLKAADIAIIETPTGAMLQSDNTEGIILIATVTAIIVEIIASLTANIVGILCIKKTRKPYKN